MRKRTVYLSNPIIWSASRLFICLEIASILWWCGLASWITKIVVKQTNGSPSVSSWKFKKEWVFPVVHSGPVPFLDCMAVFVGMAVTLQKKNSSILDLRPSKRLHGKIRISAGAWSSRENPQFPLMIGWGKWAYLYNASRFPPSNPFAWG